MIKAATKFGRSIGMQMVKLAEGTFSRFKPEVKYGVFHLCMPELGINKVASLRKVGNSCIDRIKIYDVGKEADDNVELSCTILRTMANNGTIKFDLGGEDEADEVVDMMLNELRKEKANDAETGEDGESVVKE